MKISKEYRFIVACGSLSGLIVFIGQVLANYGFSTFEISIIPYTLAVIFLLPIVVFRKHWWTKRNIWPLLLRGLIIAFGALTEFGWIAFGIPVAVIVLLLYTQPFRTIVFRYIFSKERIRRVHIVATFLVLAGVFFLVYPFSGWLVLSTTGVIVGLLWWIFLSLRVIVGGRISKKNIDPYLGNFSGIVFSLILLWIMIPIFRIFIHNPHITTFQLHWPIAVWLRCIAFAIFPEVIWHIAYLKGMKKIATVSAGIILLLEPLVATILATVFLHQPLTILIIIGWILILWGNIFIMRYDHST